MLSETSMSATAAATTAARAATRTAPPAALALASATSQDRRGALLAALADALAGALGSVVAVAVFYPIDIAKTRAQASSTSTSCIHPSHGDYSEEHHRSRGAFRSAAEIARQSSKGRRGWFRSRTLAALLSIARNEGGLTRVYEGIEAKALQALMGSFIYFYAYAFIKGVMRRRAAAGGSGSGGGGARKSLRPSLNLLAAAMAGAVNQAFTLPLENITTRMQTAPPHPQAMTGADKHRSADGSSDETESRGRGARAMVGQGGSFSGGSSGGDGGGGRGVVVDSRGDDGTHGFDQFRDVAPATPAKTPQGEEGGAGTTTNNRENHLPPIRRRQRPRQSFAAVTGELYREGGGMGRFWRGFAPSLILTCNPAINYTAFDVLKALWLRRRDAAAASVVGTGGPRSGAAGAAGNGETGQRGTGGFLNPVEAFFVAAAAKSLATVITYPLIRAKVVLMTSRSSSLSLSSSSPAVDVDSYSVPSLTLQDGDDGARWGSRGSVAKTQDAVDGVGGGRDGVDGRMLVDDEVGTVVPRLKGRGELEAGPTDARVVPIAASAAAVEGGDREVEGSNTRGMGTVLMEIFRHEGFGGLYAGCGAQLLHTILKSALLLATKEQIARAAASAVFVGGNRSGAAGSTRPRPASG